MELTEDETIEKYGEKCMRCTKNTTLPYAYEKTCIACGYNIIEKMNS